MTRTRRLAVRRRRRLDARHRARLRVRVRPFASPPCPLDATAARSARATAIARQGGCLHYHCMLASSLVYYQYCWHLLEATRLGADLVELGLRDRELRVGLAATVLARLHPRRDLRQPRLDLCDLGILLGELLLESRLVRLRNLDQVLLGERLLLLSSRRLGGSLRRWDEYGDALRCADMLSPAQARQQSVGALLSLAQHSLPTGPDPLAHDGDGLLRRWHHPAP